MITTIRAKARVNEQDPDYPTFKKISCEAYCKPNENWYGKIITCSAVITAILVAVCKSWNQGIRLVVLIDGIEVSKFLVNSLTIRHDKNMISTFLFNLGEKEYSPRVNSHIQTDKEVVITAYINGQEKKLFTGLTDEPEATRDKSGFKVMVPGRDYGKKLLDKKTTLVSIQDSAASKKRNDLISYLAEQADITDYDIPEMAEVTIDNSFQDQTIWDMIQKEIMVELYWVRFNEDGKMELKLDEVKSDIDLYPIPDWTYDEKRIMRVSYRRGRPEENKIIVLGKTDTKTIKKVSTQTTIDENWNTPKLLFSDSLSYGEGEEIYFNENLNYTKQVGDFILKIHSYGSGGGGGNVGVEIGCASQWTWHSYIITAKTGIVGGNAHLVRITDSIYGVGLTGIRWSIARDGTSTNYENGRVGKAFTFQVAVYGYKNDPYKGVQYHYDTTTETRHDQISVVVTDPNSIAKWGERDGGSIEYPLLETVEQCEAVGKRYLWFKHSLGHVDFLIPFNPLVKPGQTIKVIDRDIGLTERYYIESVEHNLSISDGKISARTGVGGAFYV